MNTKNKQKTEKTQQSPSVAKTMTGKVVSTAMDKTVIVEVVHTIRHWLYQKIVRRSKRFAVHNEMTDIAIGDTVLVASTRPISKRKHFVVVKKIV